jgi:hypothetical protein
VVAGLVSYERSGGLNQPFQGRNGEMKKFLKSKKGIVLLVSAIVAIVAAVGAYAYFTSTGAGTGTATVGDASNQVYVTGSTSGTLYPGGPARTVSFSAKNFADSAQSISKIHLVTVQACVGSWTAPSLASWPVAAPTCPDTEAADLASDANCGSIADGAGANTPLTKDFYMADINPNPASDGDLDASANRALTTTASIVMNDTDYSQNDCKNKHLLLTFSTT